MNDLNASIGEGRVAEAELSRLARIVMCSEDAIIGADLDGIIFSWNQGAERIYGFTAQEIKGKHLLTLIPPDCRDELEVVLQKINQGVHVEAFETRRVRKDGKVIHLSTTISPVREADGKATAAAIVTRDVTKLSEVQETLAKERTLLQIVLDNLTDNIYAKDAAGRYILDNPAHRNFLGVASSEEVIGRTVFDFFLPKSRNNIMPTTSRSSRSGIALLNREEATFTRSGEKRWLSTSKVPFRNSKGEVVGLVCLSHDITTSKSAPAR